MRKLIGRIQRILRSFTEHRLSASAAHAAYFIMLSFIPCVILLLSLIQYTSVSEVDFVSLVKEVIPRDMQPFITGIIYEAYQKTATTISISALMTAWSAGKGMMALTNGLQVIYGIKEERNYLEIRIRSAAYTVIFLLSIILFLLVGVFGNSLSGTLVEKIPMTAYAVNLFNQFKTIFMILVATIIFALIYSYVPGKQKKISYYMPGAVVASVGWFAFSYAFSVYIDMFTGFSNVYGSLTTLILIMLWLYFGMYIILIGAEINRIFFPRLERRREEKEEREEREEAEK